MKTYRVASIFVVLLMLLTFIQPVFAQDYFFEVPEAQVDVFIETDGTITIEYYYKFQNAGGAHVIDFVDIGMPGNSTYQLSDITANVDGKPITDISDSPYVDGVALGLGANAIPAGGSGVVYMRAENVGNLFYYASEQESEDYTSINFQPNYFGSDFVSGSTSLIVNFHLPPGLTDQEPRWINPKGWPGENTPAAGYDAENRILYQWASDSASADGRYTFGVTFPARVLPVSAINTQQTVTYNPSRVWGTVVPILFCTGILGIFVLVIVLAVKNAKKRRLKYLPPKIAIEGHGIKRGLTSVEAAILMEQPMDKILTMILFAVTKKEAAEVVKRDPLELKVDEKLPEDLRDYEKAFLEAFKEKNNAARRKKLQEMMVALVKSVGEKMKGFSRKETVTYYEEIIKKAWQQVESAETPEVRAEKYSDAADWTILDKDYETRTRRTFGTGPVFMPYWWWRTDPTIGSPGRSMGGAASKGTSIPSGGNQSKTITLPNLPGSNAAASVIGTVQAFSAGVVGNLTSFTGGITDKTNPVPVQTSSTFRSSGGRGSSGGSSCACACACACAGCACACAGGGR
ncbi:MAG: hypothetical protein PWQ55_362 [Chloroflexota bacterium]|nr:hypothetical protein [Chloroflexota bacterium]